MKLPNSGLIWHADMLQKDKIESPTAEVMKVDKQKKKNHTPLNMQIWGLDQFSQAELEPVNFNYAFCERNLVSTYGNTHAGCHMKINSMIKAIASGGLCVRVHFCGLQTEPCPSPWRRVSAEKPTQFPIFYEDGANNLRPPQPAQG